jgi:tetratricopeptide (TPR) repeat protein
MPEENKVAGLTDSERDDSFEADTSQLSGDSSAQASIDPVAAAFSLQAGQTSPELAAKQIAYLDAQLHLVTIQTEHLHEQRKLTLSHLRQRRLSDWFRTATQIYVMAGVALITIYIVAMFRDAILSRSVVVDEFGTTPALLARGLDGKALASGILDHLTFLRNATRSESPGLSVSGAWANEIKLEVPTTGVSISELDRLLRSRLGHDVHISGEAWAIKNGDIMLKVRGDDIPPASFPGTPDAIETVLSQAADYIYGQSQPAKYAAYLDDAGRSTDAVGFARAAYRRTRAAERPALLNAWANAIGDSGGDPHEALGLYEAAIALKPDIWPAYDNLMNDLILLGEEEEAWRKGRAMLAAAGGRPGPAPEIDFQPYDQITWNLAAQRREFAADAEANGGLGTSISPSSLGVAVTDALMHDAKDARHNLQTAPDSDTNPAAAALGHFVRGLLALDANDNAAALHELEAFGAAMKNPQVASNYPGFDCWIAKAEELAGRRPEADAALAAAEGNRQFVDCERFRADIIDGRGNWPEAQRAYARAAALAPDLPGAYYSWGVALMRHNDYPAAAEKFSLAHQRGPGWADPMKAWGDLLARQERWGPAASKYDAAFLRDPSWPELQQARTAVAQHLK